MTIVFVVTGAVLSLALSSRGLYETDQARTRLNQNLRSSMEFLVTDLRQAGQRLGDDFPALEIVDGSSGAPDQLIVRRNLIDTVLRVCQDVAQGTSLTDVYIADTGGTPPPGCAPVPDDDSDGWPENLQAWRDHRQAAGAARAYLYNPVSKDGEFFDYVAEDKDNYYVESDIGVVWQFDYPVSDQCRIYLLEERRYELTNGILQVILDADTSAPLRLVDDLDDFQLVALFQDGSQQTTLDATDVWSELRAVRVSLEGEVAIDGNVIERAWSSEIMPRNVLSR